MKKSELINKSLESSRRIESVKRAYGKSKPVGYNVEYWTVSEFKLDKEGKSYDKVLTNLRTSFVPGDSLEDVNDWLDKFETLQEAFDRKNRF